MAPPLSVSSAIRNAMDEDPRSTNKIARTAGIEPVTLYRFVNGKGGMSFASLDKLAATLGVTIAAIA